MAAHSAPGHCPGISLSISLSLSLLTLDSSLQELLDSGYRPPAPGELSLDPGAEAVSATWSHVHCAQLYDVTYTSVTDKKPWSVQVSTILKSWDKISSWKHNAHTSRMWKLQHIGLWQNARKELIRQYLRDKRWLCHQRFNRFSPWKLFSQFFIYESWIHMTWRRVKEHEVYLELNTFTEIALIWSKVISYQVGCWAKPSPISINLT